MDVRIEETGNHGSAAKVDSLCRWTDRLCLPDSQDSPILNGDHGRHNSPAIDEFAVREDEVRPG
jgi:hypothetical protein